MIESGLKYWASIRQSYIAITDLFRLMDPIMFHQPLNTCMEMVTDEDAGYGLVQTLDCPDDFYGRIYNMGGGPGGRITFIDYLSKMMRLLGLGDFRKIMDRDWFALRNFHCSFFEDSGVLNEYLGHWRQSVEDHCQQVIDEAPWYVALGKLAPSVLVKKFLMKRDGKDRERSPRLAEERERRPDQRLLRLHGRRSCAIPGWDGAGATNPRGLPATEPRLRRQQAGRRAHPRLTCADAADFRGGQCLTEAFEGMRPPAWSGSAPLDHTWKATPTLVLRAGHWCPECLPPAWNYDAIAKKNPFFAQIYYPNHDRDEQNFYDARCFEDIV